MKKISILILLLLGIAQAHADWKGYSGTNCLPANESADFYRSIISPSFANMGNSPITVICPVVRDVSAGGVGRVLLARVRLTNQNPVGGYCRFYSRDIQGDAHDFQHENFNDLGRITLTFGPVNASNWGSYFIACRIPGSFKNKKSFIRTYSVEEVG